MFMRSEMESRLENMSAIGRALFEIANSRSQEIERLRKERDEALRERDEARAALRAFIGCGGTCLPGGNEA